MGHNRRHAALAALCVLAVLLAASLFPASGFGTYPAGSWSDRGASAPDGATGPDSGIDGSDGAAETTVSDGTPTTGAETTDGTSPEDETTTETTTETTAAGESDGDGSDEEPLLTTLVAAVGLGIAVLFGVGVWAGAIAVTSTTGRVPFTVTFGGTPVGALIGGLPERTMTLVVGLSAAVPQLLDDAASLGREVGDGLSMVTGATGRALASAASVAAGGLGATVVAVPRALAGLATGASVLSRMGSGLSLPSFGRNSGGSSRNRSSAGNDTEPPETAPPSVEEAWETMAGRVFLRNRRAATPEEVARAAVERGYPDGAVRRLTDAFQEVRYGGFARDDRTSAARSALDRLRQYWEGDE